MSSPIWTADALSSELRPWRGMGWRLVEAQHRVATLPLVDTLEEQELLERLIEETEPPVP
ncbi:MAG TPA: RES domain-containing protein, partial [Rhodospirillales bacterium]|nr:RES domain-containing protein [Rhodospirillales bacterium]